jgi:hypothetical protein
LFCTLFYFLTEVVVVPDINDVQSWSEGLIQSWDGCVFTNDPKETPQSVPTSERVVVVEESDPEQLPSNQEAYKQESQPVIDNQHIAGLIQDSVKTALNAFEVRFDKRLNAIERRLDAYESTQQQQGIWLKQCIAAQRLHSGTVQKVAREQSLTTELLKQLVLMLKKKLG